MVSPARASFNVRLLGYNSCVIVTYAVLYHPEAEAERDRLPRNERLAIATAVEKLETFGPNLRLRIKARLWGPSISANSDHEPVAVPGDRSTGALRKIRS
jgi:hypothetical protein